MGFVVPVIRIVDNMRMKPHQYRIRLRESVIASYELMPDHFLAMNPGLVEEEIEGIPTEEPAFGLQAVWVGRENRDRAERLGYTIVEPSAVLATHLTELLYAHSDELVTREDVQNLITHLKETAPTVVSELVPNILTLGELQKVLHNLLRERVSIRNLQVILEVLSNYGPRTKDTDVLSEYVRHALAREICANYVDEKDTLAVVTLAPALEKEILDAVSRGETGDYVPVSPARSDQISERTAAAVAAVGVGWTRPRGIDFGPRAALLPPHRRAPDSEEDCGALIHEIDPAVHLQSEGQVKAES